MRKLKQRKKNISSLFKEGDTVFYESEDETSTGSMSISDEDSCDDYSVYSDNTCPDE